jgi:hypothetical protein
MNSENKTYKAVKEWIRLYTNDFKKSLFYWFVAFFGVFYLLQIPIKKAINIFWVDPIISHCITTSGADVAFYLLLFFSLGRFVYRLYKNLIPTLNSILFGVVLLLVYNFFFLNDSAYFFYEFSLGILKNCHYASVLLLSSLLIGFTYKSYRNPLIKIPSVHSLLDDAPFIDSYSDQYGRTKYANSIANHINCTSSSISIAIGIVGDWGAGKSDFLSRLKSSLRENPENIIFDFNPWRVNKADAIIEEFFKAFSKILRPYNQTITSQISDYSSRILKTAKETHFRIFDLLIGEWFHEEGIQEKYDLINSAIKATSKRIVIFIDDVDRLSGKEVMEVLRIIRNTASFANTFFVVGIDHNYIVEVLKNTNDFSNEAEYLKKVFQLTITLPAFKKDGFINEIEKILLTPDMATKYQEQISSALRKLGNDVNDEITLSSAFAPAIFYEDLLEKMIDNIRDLKRFCNSFKITFDILKGEADIHDLIVLELIRNKDIEVYNAIRNRSIVVLDFMTSSNKFTIDENKWGNLKAKIAEKDRDHMEIAIRYLFKDEAYKSQRKFVYAQNFYIYFSYQLFNLISFNEFNQTLEEESDQIISQFKKWIDAGQVKELQNIISFLEDFKDAESFKKFVVTLLKLWIPRSNWLEYAKHLVVVGWIHNQKKYFQNNGTIHREFLISILDDESIDPFVRTNLAWPFLNAIFDNPQIENELFIRRRDLRSKIFHLFNAYLKSDFTNPQKAYEFYHLNDRKVKNGVVTYLPAASRYYKRFLLNNPKEFEGYTKLLLRPSQTYYEGKIVLEPFLEQIFVDWRIYKAALSSVNFANESMTRLKRIILEYIDGFYKNGREPLYIQNDDDRVFIEKYLSLK